ncbi:lysozyme [Acinetobacter sp.]|uniref:lysozyme n=1 Tax=Acinetobacter sp. TaxID=472 RepID=UPI00388FC650
MSKKKIFDFIRGLVGKLSQSQVDVLDQALNEIGVAEDSQKTISSKGVEFIAGFESLQLKAYLCPANVWTIGWGTTVYPNGTKVKKGDKCTVEQAKVYKDHDLKRFQKCVNDAVAVLLNQNQFDALVSLTYNIGEAAFKSSTLLKKLNAADYNGAADQFLVWNKSKGKVLNGLVNRRAAERTLFLKP